MSTTARKSGTRTARKATHKTTHKTTHTTTHKTVHKTHTPKAKKATRRVGLVIPDGLLLNDRLNTCALLAWWNACVSVYDKSVPTPDDEYVAKVYSSFGGDSEDGLYLESVLERAMRSGGLFGYRLVDIDGTSGVVIGSADDHAYGGDDALDVMLDDAWLIDMVIV